MFEKCPLYTTANCCQDVQGSSPDNLHNFQIFCCRGLKVIYAGRKRAHRESCTSPRDRDSKSNPDSSISLITSRSPSGIKVSEFNTL